jgi:hypothetical protein
MQTACGCSKTIANADETASYTSAICNEHSLSTVGENIYWSGIKGAKSISST